MTYKTFYFAGLATDISDCWNLPKGHPLEDCTKFCLGLFMIGEATYCCELSPSSYVVDISNEFCNPDGSYLTEAQLSAIDNESLDLESLDHGYQRFIDPKKAASNPRVSAAFEVDIDLSEYDRAAYDSEADWLDAIRRAAWEEAREYASSNGAAILPPILGGQPFQPVELSIQEAA